MPVSLPITIVGGYLGAGKTTLINNLLRQAQPQGPDHGHPADAGIRLAVLVNDFGDIAIDAALIESVNGNVMQLAGGCVCCTIGSDLISTILSLSEIAPETDHVLIETSGVALPGTVAATISIARGVKPNGVVVLADAVNFERQRRDKYIGDTITRQLDAANLIVLTKCDQIDVGQCQQLTERLAAEYPKARIVPVADGNLPLAVALDAQRAVQSGGTTPVSPNRPFSPGHQADAQYQSLSFINHSGCDVTELIRLLSDPDNQVLRAKGIVKDLAGGTHVVQCVASSARSDPGDMPTDHAALVVIGLKTRLNRSEISAQLSLLGFEPASSA